MLCGQRRDETCLNQSGNLASKVASKSHSVTYVFYISAETGCHDDSNNRISLRAFGACHLKLHYTASNDIGK